MKASINVDHIARVEGHGNVHVVIEDGEVKTVQMEVVEPARLFESMVCGRSFTEVSYVSSRICGICSASHTVTDLLAIERIFGVDVTDRTNALRELLVYGSYLQNHGTHLYVLAAPDFLGQKSVFPVEEINPELFDSALALKQLGNELCTAVGGRSIHPITAVVGGFTHEISAGEYLAFAERMEAMLPFALETVDLFNSFAVPDLQSTGDMLAMYAPDKYAVCDSRVAKFIDAGLAFDADEWTDAIEEYQVPHSGALFARVRSTGKNYMTSALARMNVSWSQLCKQAKVAAAKAGLRPPERNPYRNNVAQAVELVDALERCAILCRRLAAGEFEGASEPVPFEVRAGRGVGYTEAPRGVLFHDLELDDAGRVVHASIITPTSQNVANMEDDMRQLVELMVAQGADEPAIKLEVEKLVRSYDPCLSCSVH